MESASFDVVWITYLGGIYYLLTIHVDLVIKFILTSCVVYGQKHSL